MRRRTRRALYYLGAFLGVVVLYTLVYSWGMATFEGQPRSLTESLLVVVETFTTTGYGEDAIWQSPEMILLMVAMQFTGVFFIFMALPLFVAPWLEARMSTTPPTAVGDLADHVVICSYTSRIQNLISELDVLEVPHVVVEPDRERAADLHDADVTVVHGDPESTRTLLDAGLERARGLVVDVDDEVNASIVLSAKQVNDAVQVITFVEDPDLAAYHRYAGADHVFSPRQLIGESLANKVTTNVTAELGDAVEIGEDFEIVELPVQAGSELAGVTVAESGIRERTGANVVGAWFRGEFVSPPSPDAYIDERTVLLVAGKDTQLEKLKEMTLTEKRRRRRGGVVVGGYGEVGSTVKERVTAAGLPCVAVDGRERPGVDVVGDVTHEDTLRGAGIDEASTVVLALSDDTQAVFATLVIRELEPDIEIIARANDTDSVRKLYRAGADYVLALATVSGRMLASTLLEEDVMTFVKQVEVVRMEAGSLAGQTLAGTDIRGRTGCTVVAVERDGHVVTDLDPEFTFEPDDVVVVAGPDESVNEFTAIVTR